MLKAILMILVSGLVGCAMQPQTPEQAAAYRQMGNAFSQGARDLNQIQQSNHHPAPMQNCTYQRISHDQIQQTCY